MSTIVKERSNLLNVEVSRRNDRNVDIKKGIELKRGDLVFVQLPEASGSIQSGERVAVVVSNNANNLYSPNISICPLTSKMSKRPLPTHVLLEVNETNNLRCKSIVLAEQTMVLSKENIKFKTGKLTDEELEQVNKAIAIQLGLI